MDIPNRPSTLYLLFTPPAVSLHLVAMVRVAQTDRKTGRQTDTQTDLDAVVGLRGADASQADSPMATIFTLSNKSFGMTGFSFY